MKKTLAKLLLLLLCSAAVVFRPAQGHASAAAYAIADGTTGHILEGRQLDKRLPIASLTKVATAIVVLDWAEREKRDINALIPIPASALSVGGANPVGFIAGEQISLRDLLYAALLQSDNVAAVTLANHVGRTLRRGENQRNVAPVDLFVAQMNALARKLGMERTRFLNPHGLDRDEQPYSTVRDLVLLTNYAMQRSAFRFHVSQKERRIRRHQITGEATDYLLVNTNTLLGTHSIDGVKTGRTRRAGDCLILSSARHPESTQNPDGTHTITPRRLTVVLLNAPDRFRLGDNLMQKGWHLYDRWAAQGRPLREK